MDKSNLIVNYLQAHVSEEDLSALFCPFGPVQSLKIVRDKGTGISMGFGFVNFETNEAAASAAVALNGLELHGKRIKVSVARPAWKANIHSNLYVANLPTTFTEQEVIELMGPELGPHVEHVRMLKNSEALNGHEFRGVAVARFDTEESACFALEMLNTVSVTSPTTGAQAQVHAKPWRPEFRPERAAGALGTKGRRKLSIESQDGLITPPPPPPPPYRPPGTMISEAEEAVLASSFEQFGGAAISMFPDRSWGQVRFPNMHAAMAAVNNLTGFSINGKILELETATHATH